MHSNEVLSDFLIEAWELIDTLDQELVQLESRKHDIALLDSIFRVMHTLKGCAGFVNLATLERVSHSAESILDRFREGRLPLDGPTLDLLFETADSLRNLLLRVEKEGHEGEAPAELLRRLERCARGEDDSEPDPPPPDPPAPPPPEIEEKTREDLLAQTLPPASEIVSPPETDPGLPAEDAPDSLLSSDQWVRVRSELLDKLMNLMGELVLCRNQLLQLSTRLGQESLNSGTQRLNLITSELQEHITQTKMQAISTILGRFPRIVRELAKQGGKDIRLVMEGQDTGLDRTILEAIKDPLIHILRNAIDHGIEPPEERIEHGKPGRATLTLRAYHEGGQVTIEIGDDGRGVDTVKLREQALIRGFLSTKDAERLSERDLVRLIFQPGLSTAESITNLSGRGVGMDVVRSSIEKIGGTVDIATGLGQGTTVKLRIPLTLAIIPALMVKVGEQSYAIPQINLQELVHLDPKNVESIHGTEVYRLRGGLLPLLRLRTLLSAQGDDNDANIVVVQSDGRPFGVVVDAECDTEEIVVKPLARELKKLQLYAGATIMGDGRVALILDVAGLARCGGLVLGENEERKTGADNQHTQASLRSQSLLLFRLDDQEQYAIPLTLVSRLEEFPQARLEQAAGRSLVQYRGSLLPLICLAEALGRPQPARQVLQVLVFSHEERNLGVIVGEILDVVEEHLELDNSFGDESGILGTAIVQGRAVTVIDILGLLRRSSPEWLERAPQQRRRQLGGRVLLAQDSDFFRTLTRSYLEIEGYQVVEADGVDQAMHSLTQEDIDAVLVDVSMDRSEELLVYASGEHAALGMVTRPDSRRPSNGNLNGIEIVQNFDRDHLVDALRRSRESQGGQRR